MGLVRKRSVVVRGRPTSVSLEVEFWDVLKSIAVGRSISLNALIETIIVGEESNLSSALRVYALRSLITQKDGGGE